MTNDFRFQGCMPANLLPFRADLEIDEAAYRKHLRSLADAPGVTAIVANGHAAEVSSPSRGERRRAVAPARGVKGIARSGAAAEVSSLSREEGRRALALALDEVAGKVPIIAGVYADGTQEAIELGLDARAAGAAGLPAFPPPLFTW